MCAIIAHKGACPRSSTRIEASKVAQIWWTIEKDAQETRAETVCRRGCVGAVCSYMKKEHLLVVRSPWSGRGSHGVQQTAAVAPWSNIR